MRIRTLMLLTPLLFVGADAPPADALKKEVEQLQGSWVAVFEESDGDRAAVRDFKVLVQGNKLTFNPDKSKREALFALDRSKTPPEIVLTPLDGPGKGKPRRGIYSLEKNQFKLCVNNTPGTENDAPPKTFATSKGDGVRFLLLKRERP